MLLKQTAEFFDRKTVLHLDGGIHPSNSAHRNAINTMPCIFPLKSGWKQKTNAPGAFLRIP